MYQRQALLPASNRPCLPGRCQWPLTPGIKQHRSTDFNAISPASLAVVSQWTGVCSHSHGGTSRPRPAGGHKLPRLLTCHCFTSSKPSSTDGSEDGEDGQTSQEPAPPSTLPLPSQTPSSSSMRSHHVPHLHQRHRLTASLPQLPTPPARPSTLSTVGAASGGALSTPPQPSFWMLLLQYLATQLGRALRALAIAFCLLALLLMRPRVAGASELFPSLHMAHPTASVTTTFTTHSQDTWQPSSIARPTHTTTSTTFPSWHPILCCITSSLLPTALKPHPDQLRQQGSNPLAEIADTGSSLDSSTHVLDSTTASTSHDLSISSNTATAAVLTPSAVLAAHEAAVTALFKSAQTSVVNISGARAAGTFSSLDVSRHVPGLGSGVVWDDKGHVVTTYSCVRGAAEVKVTLADASSYTAKLVGADPAKDLAVLRLSMPKARLKELVPIRPGVCHGPGGLTLGASLWAIGNATGLDHTLTQGVVSGLGREVPGGGPYPLKALIQFDGASGHQAGGLLINSQGKAVGMVVAPSQAEGRAAGYGLGYALPIDTMKGLVTQILTSGKTSRPTLGITLAPPQVLAAQGVEGVLVLEVPPGSPAATAGLRHTHRDIFGDVILGDVIVGIEGGVVRHVGDLYSVLDNRKAGERVRLDILRDGKSTSLTVVLGERGLAGSLEE